MAEEQTNLLPFYKGWETYQELLIRAIRPLTDEQLTLRTSPDLHTIGENVAHILATRSGWFHGLMGEGDDSLEPLEHWDEPGRPARSVAELISGLEQTWQMVHNALAHWTPADLDYVFEGKWNGKPYHLTRQWVIWHVIEHDLHHGGEVSFTLGTYKLAGIDI